MKISNPTAGAPAPTSINPNEGKSTSAEKIARAKAAFAGVTLTPQPELNPDGGKQLREESTRRKIQMKTQRSVYRDYEVPSQQVEAAPAVTATEPVSDISVSDPVEPQASTVEDSKPLSPQFAALAKAKRALQVKEREIAEREAALAGKGTEPAPDYLSRVKSDPLGVLKEAGVTYDQLTEAVLAGNSPQNPNISRLEAEIQSLKKGLEDQNNSLTEKEKQNEQQALSLMRKDADQLVAEGDTFEMIRETNSQADVIDLIERTYRESGELLDVEEACNLVEKELVEESLKIAKIKKIQSKLAPESTQSAPQNPANRTLKTLTARDGTSVPLTARERALLAFKGQLPR